MLLSPLAVEKLKGVTRSWYWPYITHEQRNELARMFLQEAGRLLDQKAESAIYHAVERYSKGELPYERYIELIEQVSQDEAAKGAAYGAEYARNRVFDFAQKALDRVQEQAYALALTDAKKQYESEKQKTEQGIKDLMQHYEQTLRTMLEQQETDLTALTQQQKADLMQEHERIVERAKTEIEQVLLKHFQEERNRLEQEIREQEALRPAREAARAAIERVEQRSRRAQAQRRWRGGIFGLGVLVVLALIILLLFVPLPQWVIVLTLLVVIVIFVIASLWRSADATLAEDRRQVALYQTQSGEYAGKSEEERIALLVQKIP
jgi:uncharacterized membrane protein